MRRRELERLMIEWQGCLRLLDWELDLLLEADEDVPTAYGTIDYDIAERSATIRIRPRQEDPELTLVHELLHLWVEPLTTVAEEFYLEQAVEALSRALVGLKRQNDVS